MNDKIPRGKPGFFLLLPIILACCILVVPALLWKPGMQINYTLLVKGAFVLIFMAGFAGFIWQIRHGGDLF